MSEIGKTKEQMANELAELHQQIAQLKVTEAEHKKLEESAISLSVNAIALANLEGNLTYINKSFLSMFGYNSEQGVLGKPATRFWQEKEKALEVVEALRDKGSWIGELVAKREDGSLFDVQLSSSMITDESGKPIRMMTSFVDITEQKQAQEALQKSAEHYRLLAENVTDVVFSLDMDLRFEYVSPSITRLAGYSVEETMAQSLLELLTPTSFEVVMETFTEELAIENMEQKDLSRSRLLELQLRCKDGSTVWIEGRMTFLRESDTQAIGILGVIRDITERKQTEESLLFSAAAFMSIQESVVAVDMEYTITHWNEVSEQIYGIEASEVIGKNLFDVIEVVETSPGEAIERVKKLESQGYYQDEVLHRTKRAEVWVNVIVQAIEDNTKRYGWVALATNTTERKKAGEKVQELYQKEAALRKELQVEIDKRIEFTRTLVHELKTPLTPMIAASDLVLEEIPEGPLFRLVRSINQGANTLSSRIDSLLDVAKGEMNILELFCTETDLLDLLHRIAQDTIPLAYSRNQVLNVELPRSLPKVSADKERLRQVIVNLLDNSFKITPEGGKITIRAKTKDNSIIVEVEDTGNGIPVDQQRHLFQTYYYTKGKSEHSRGLGLGLTLSRMLVELHGGKIWVESQEGKGSIFSFSLPLGSSSS